MTINPSTSNADLFQRAWQLSIDLMPLFSLAESDVSESLLERTQELMTASGLIMLIDGKFISYGSVPNQQQTQQLLVWLSQQTQEAVFSCTNLAEQFPVAAEYPNQLSALLALGIPVSKNNGLAWFRSKNCLPWSDHEIEISRFINNSLSEVFTQQHLMAELIEERKQMSFFFNNTPTLIGYWDVNLINQFCNNAYSKWFGQSPAAIKGKHLRELLGDKVYNSISFEIAGAMNGEIQQFERHYTNAETGETIYTLTSYYPDMENGQIKGFFVIGVDITDHVRLKDLSLKNETILNSMTKGILLTDQNQQVIYINPTFEDMSGYTLTDLQGKDFDVLQGSNTDQKEVQKIKAALTDQQVYQGEILSYRKNGTEFWNEIHINPIYDAKNKLSQFIYFQSDISNRKRLEVELITSESQFRTLANAAPVLIWLAGLDKLCYWFNTAWLEFTGRSMEQENGNGWAEGVHPEDFDRCLDIYVTNFDKRLPFRMEYRLRRYDGEYRWIDDYGVPRFNEQREFEGYIGACTDVTDIRNSKTASDFYNISHEIIYSTDIEGRILEVNARFLEVTGYQLEEVIGKNVKLLQSSIHEPDFFSQISQSLNETDFWSGEITNKNKAGQLFTAITSTSAIRNTAGQVVRYLTIASDISTVVESRNRLELLAHYDTLTKLPNRMLYMDRLKKAMATINREGDNLAVMFIDLDGFKQINDVYGHDIGDKVLITVSQRMKKSLRETDTVARLGGDEFIVLLTGLSAKEMAGTPAKHLLQACSSPIIVNDLTLNVSASIGISLYNKQLVHQGLTIDSLINQADQAMYVAKQSGKNRYHYFDEM